ncbi:hypothetical protein GCM10023148_42870 [Actinokineospora soli]
MVAAVAVLAAGIAGCGVDEAPAGSVVVPLTYLAPGAAGGALGEPRLAARVTVAGAVLHVLVDTGSTGLKVLASKVTGAVRKTGVRGTTSYLSGLRIDGDEARASVRLGAASADDVTVLLVDRLSCTPDQPRCEAAGGATPEEFGAVFDGIMGIGMALRSDGETGCCANPMSALTDNGSFVVHFDPVVPELWLNPPEDTIARFRTASLRVTGANGVQTYDPAPMRACVTVSDVIRDFCAPVVFDTGTPDLVLLAPKGALAPPRKLLDRDLLPTGGKRVTFAVADIWTWSFTGAPLGEGDLDDAMAVLGNLTSPPVVEIMPEADPLVLVGLPGFTSADVLYDLGGARIGLAER